MRYWVYINDKVIEMPFEEGELSAIKGFNGNTLICKETPAPGEAQEWVPAKMLIEAYKQPVPPPPPPPQVIAKFKEESKAQESKATILSSNIFGEDNKKEEKEPQAEGYKTNLTEAIFPQEQDALSEEEKLKEELFQEPPTEIVSIDEVEEIDVDSHASDKIESEEEILKTAIKTIVSPKPKKKEDNSLHAVDIANNTNIDLSDVATDEENAENKQEEQEGQESEQQPEQQENKTENFDQTALTRLGNKKPLTRLFDSEPVEEEVPAPQEEQKEPSVHNEPTVEQEALTDNEEEFEAQEEISLDEDSSGIISKTEEAEKKEPYVEEIVSQDIVEEIPQEKPEEKEIEEAFVTTPAFTAEEPENTKEDKKEIEEENPAPETESILEAMPSTVSTTEEHPTTLDELTGRYPIEQEEQAQPAPQEEKKDDVFIPAEVHPDVIVEEVKEEETKQKENPAEVPAQETATLDKDNFLNTFSSDIETVFLDQPTAFISDYIPPEETSEEKEEQAQAQNASKEGEAKEEILDIKSSQGQHQVSLQNVRRVKPAAIKTVPMVEGEQVDPFSQTQIRNIENAEEAIAKVERNENYLNIFKTFILVIVLMVMALSVLGLISYFDILPKNFSPLHAISSLMPSKDKKEKQPAKVKENKLTPEEIALQDLKEAEVLRINKIISEVKEYKLPEGITLEEKIKLLHPAEFSKLEWSASQLPTDLTYYSVKVTSPTNPEGYASVNYRFNYNTVTYTVEATTSEATNIMIKPYNASAQQQAQASTK